MQLLPHFFLYRVIDVYICITYSLRNVYKKSNPNIDPSRVNVGVFLHESEDSRRYCFYK